MSVTRDELVQNMANLCVVALLDGLLHGLQGITGKLGRHDKFPVNVLDLFHHVRLEFGEGFMEAVDALQDLSRGFDMDVCGGAAFAAERLEDGVDLLDRGQLVVENVCPGVSPLLCGGFELVGSCQSART